EKLYEALEKGKITGLSNSVVEKLKAGKESAFFSKKLVTLYQDVPIIFSLKENEFGKFNKNKLLEVFKDLGFVSLIERLKSAGGPAGTSGQGVLMMPVKTVAKIKYKKIPRDLNWGELNKELKEAKEIYLSYRLKDGGSLKSVAISDNKNIYLLENNFLNIAEIFSDRKIKKTGHDFKSLIKALWKEGIDLEGLEFDAMIAAYVLNPGEHSYEIGKLIVKEFGETLPADAEYSMVFEASILKELKSMLSARLITTKTEKVFKEIEIPLIPVLSKMEVIGIKLDSEKLKKISGQLENKLEDLEKEIYKLAGEKFNIDSPRQLAEILFVKLKIPGARKGGRIKKTPGGALSTGAGELEKLRIHHEIIDYILRYRGLAKLKSTYADTLPNLIDENNRLRTTFNQTGTTTGRLSSQEPNLQNIPARGDWGDEIRGTFIAESGFKFISADYSQIHLRIIAALANDKKMIEAFAKGLDIHKFTASEINNVPIDRVTPEMRFAAKELNFGIIYGMGSQSFAEAAKISGERAEQFINEYLKDFSGIARYVEKLKDEAHKNGFAATLFGRRRYLPELNSPNYMLRSQAERMAINMPIQGLEADIVKKAMIEVNNWIQKGGYGDKIRMLLQVHDELLFEVKENLVEEAAPKIAELMESVIKLKVPIIAETKVGDNWAELDLTK
ncbi:MAG: DNA polymerase I, partial [Candidatus Azambacteria bacterium]|nr:DNA polymerase I [Candidatus Azambacteria bacterium]